MTSSDLMLPNGIDPSVALYLRNLQDRVRALETQLNLASEELTKLKSRVQTLES